MIATSGRRTAVAKPRFNRKKHLREAGRVDRAQHSGVAKPRFNRKKYQQLLTAALPRVIETPEELARVNKVIAPFLHPERALAPEEEDLVRLMLKLIEDYNRTHPAFPPFKPHELLQALMAEGNLRQVDLLDVFGSRARASQAVTGKRAISKPQAKRLGERFRISPTAFVEVPGAGKGRGRRRSS